MESAQLEAKFLSDKLTASTAAYQQQISELQSQIQRGQDSEKQAQSEANILREQQQQTAAALAEAQLQLASLKKALNAETRVKLELMQELSRLSSIS